MFIQKLRDFDACARRDDRFARVNVELEQSAHTVDLWTTDGKVQRRLAVVVDRVLIDAVQRTHQKARACVSFFRRAMQRCSTFLLWKKDFSHETTDIFQQNSPQKTDPSLFRSLPVAPQAISVSSTSVHFWKAAPCIGCQLINRHEERLKRTDNFENNNWICAYPDIFSTWILAPF